MTKLIRLLMESITYRRMETRTWVQRGLPSTKNKRGRRFWFFQFRRAWEEFKENLRKPSENLGGA